MKAMLGICILLMLLLAPTCSFSQPAQSNPPQNQSAATQEDLRVVLVQLTKAVSTLAENSKSAKNQGEAETMKTITTILAIIVPIILAMGLLYWKTGRVEGRIIGVEKQIDYLEKLIHSEIDRINDNINSKFEGLKQQIERNTELIEKNTGLIEKVAQEVRECRSDIDTLRERRWREEV